MAKVAHLVKPDAFWSPSDFHEFLVALPPAAMLELKKKQGLLGEGSSETDLMGPEIDAQSIQGEVLKGFYSVWQRPFRDASNTEYHAVVAQVARDIGIPKDTIGDRPTFSLEHEISQFLFMESWDKLTPAQREKLLKELDKRGAITDKAKVATLSGATAIGVLNTAVAISGFAFYTAMSSAIAVTAATAGITLPFAAYAGASTTVGVLCGPVGWAVMGAAALGGLALAGRPKKQKLTALVMQVHALKVEALQAAGLPFPEIRR